MEFLSPANVRSQTEHWAEDNRSDGGLIITFKTENISDDEDEQQNQIQEDGTPASIDMFSESKELCEWDQSCEKYENFNHEFPETEVREETERIKTEFEVSLDIPETLDSHYVKIKEEPLDETLLDDDKLSNDTTDSHSCSECELEQYSGKTHCTKNLMTANNIPYPVYKCNDCKAIFDSKTKLMDHIFSKCGDSDNLECNICKVKFQWGPDLMSHFETHFNLDRVGEERYECKLCDVKFDSDACYKNLCVHKYAEKRKYKCNHCDATFKCKSNVKIHATLKHSNVRNFECHLCHAKFKIKYILKKHIDVKHSDVRNFGCTLCSSKFKTKSEVKSHIKFKHSEERNFKCVICDARFKTKAHLSAHRNNTHSTVRNFECSICTAKFKSKSALTRHMKYNASKLHSHAQMFDSDKSNPYSNKFDVGLQSHSKMFECEICHTKFKAELPLKLHVALSHLEKKK